MSRTPNPAAKPPVLPNPPPGTRSFELGGTRYDLMPHGNGQDTLLMEQDAGEPARIRSSWISTGPGVEAFMRNWGNRAAALPEGTPIEERFRSHAEGRLAEDRPPIDLDEILASSGARRP
jgi:hypothetical protein